MQRVVIGEARVHYGGALRAAAHFMRVGGKAILLSSHLNPCDWNEIDKNRSSLKSIMLAQATHYLGTGG